MVQMKNYALKSKCSSEFFHFFTILPSHFPVSNWFMTECFPPSLVFLPRSIPAETCLLVKHQSPLQWPGHPTLKPALAAEHRWQADGRCYIAWWSTLPKVRQEKPWPSALAHCIQSSCRLPVANVAYSLTQISRITKLLQLDGGEWRAIVAAAVENCRKVAMGQCSFTQL